MEGWGIVLLGLVFLVLAIGLLAAIILSLMKIAQKAGYHPALGLLALVPYVNILILFLFAFRRWPIYEAMDAQKISSEKPLSGWVVTALCLFGMVPVLFLLTAIAVPNFMRANVSANDALARQTLQILSRASENYARDHGGLYPGDIADLLSASPAYLSRDYCRQHTRGYRYTCRSFSSGYEYQAMPQESGKSGSQKLVIRTGGILLEEGILPAVDK